MLFGNGTLYEREIFMLISYVIPAYNSSATIKRTLDSVFNVTLPASWSVEALVVDDGSLDSAALAAVTATYNGARLLSHEANRGMCAGRNTGITESCGDIVTILDSDDELVSDWPVVLATVMNEWSINTQVCYVACCNSQGQVTASDPNYNGTLTLNDLLNERQSGEYIPLFRGDYVRDKLYIDLGLHKSCGIVSYINFVQDAPFWISSRVMRIYHDDRVGSVSSGWTNPKKARETVQCYLELFQRYGHLYQRDAPKVWCTKQLRLAVYLRLSKMPGAWTWWWRGASFTCIKESAGAFMILAFGRRMGAWLAQVGKRMGIIRRYG